MAAQMYYSHSFIFSAAPICNKYKCPHRQWI